MRLADEVEVVLHNHGEELGRHHGERCEGREALVRDGLDGRRLLLGGVGRSDGSGGAEGREERSEELHGICFGREGYVQVKVMHRAQRLKGSAEANGGIEWSERRK